jgi:hypothetical protein
VSEMQYLLFKVFDFRYIACQNFSLDFVVKVPAAPKLRFEGDGKHTNQSTGDQTSPRYPSLHWCKWDGQDHISARNVSGPITRQSGKLRGNLIFLFQIFQEEGHLRLREHPADNIAPILVGKCHFINLVLHECCLCFFHYL